jgi:hypothetical protein
VGRCELWIHPAVIELIVIADIYLIYLIFVLVDRIFKISVFESLQRFIACVVGCLMFSGLYLYGISASHLPVESNTFFMLKTALLFVFGFSALWCFLYENPDKNTWRTYLLLMLATFCFSFYVDLVIDFNRHFTIYIH